MVQTTRLDRARGALLGSAIGDALGAPLEGLTSAQIQAHYGLVDDFVDGSAAWKRKPYRWRLPGLYSDDTQQALVLADVLLACGEIDPERTAALYLALATPPGMYVGAHRGVGRSFRMVIEALRQGASPRDTGQPSAGPGAATRIAPLAIFFAGQPEALFEAVMAASLITHRDCRSLAGAVAVAHAIRRLAAGALREPSFVLRLAGDVCHAELILATRFAERIAIPADRVHSLSTAIAHVEALLDVPRERALQAIVEEANRHGPTDACRRPTIGFAPALIPTCLYLLLTTDSFEEALIEAVNLGGDADTAGAILGAMAGASYGLKAIPERWLSRLQNREGLTLRAEALARRSAEGIEIPDLVATEWRLSELEGASRNSLLLRRHHGDDLGANRRV